jgi:hypothetical protein
MVQCYKNLYRGNLLTFHGIAIILTYKTVFSWQLLLNDSKLPLYGFIRLAPHKSTQCTNVSSYYNPKKGVRVNQRLYFPLTSTDFPLPRLLVTR